MHVYKLMDLVSTIDVSTTTTDILLIQPLSTNYLVNVINEHIVQVTEKFTESTHPLFYHLRLAGITDCCFLKLSDSDKEILDKHYP